MPLPAARQQRDPLSAVGLRDAVLYDALWMTGCHSRNHSDVTTGFYRGPERASGNAAWGESDAFNSFLRYYAIRP